MKDETIEIEGIAYLIKDLEDMYILTVNGTFVGYFSLDYEYIGKFLPLGTITQISKHLHEINSK